MRVLVVGLGSIGRRHIKNLKAVDASLDIAVLREHSKSKDTGDVASLVSTVFCDLKEALAWRPQVTVIANPAPMHIATAKAFALIGSHLFIEKPISVCLEGIEELIALCRQQRIVVMVGYVLRFAPPLEALKKAVETGKIGKLLSMSATVGRYLPAWRSGDYRAQVSSQKKLGGGVVLELSHEIDYLRWLAGDIVELKAMTAKLSDFEMDAEDTAEIILKFKNNVLAHVHLDMLDRASHRGCRLIGDKGTLVWDSVGGDHKVALYDEKEQWQTLYEVKALDGNVMHIKQWEHFFACVSAQRTPLNSLEGAALVLKASLEVLSS